MKEIKITEKTSKKGLVDYLKSYLTDCPVVDARLAERVKYAVEMFGKDQTKVMKADLHELAEEVVNAVKALTPATPAPVEASLKPKKSLGKSKKSEAPAEEVKETPAEVPEEVTTETPEAEEAPKKEKKSSKKSTLTKSKDSKKPEVETIPPATNVGVDNLPSAKMFPAEIDHPELGKIVACTGAYTTYADILKALNEEKTLYFAVYWTKAQLKKFDYADNFLVPAPKGGFPLNLDILMAVIPCETVERVYAMSRITEALYRFEGPEFEYIEDVDPRSGDKFRIRVTGGAEFEIYRPEDEEIVTAE